MGQIILPHEMGLIEVFFGVSHCENVGIKLHILIPPPQTIHHEYFYILSFLYCLSWIDDPTANIYLFAIIELSFSYISPCSLKTFRSIKCTYSIYAYIKMKNGQKMSCWKQPTGHFIFFTASANTSTYSADHSWILGICLQWLRAYPLRYTSYKLL